MSLVDGHLVNFFQLSQLFTFKLDSLLLNLRIVEGCIGHEVERIEVLLNLSLRELLEIGLFEVDCDGLVPIILLEPRLDLPERHLVRQFDSLEVEHNEFTPLHLREKTECFERAKGRVRREVSDLKRDILPLIVDGVKHVFSFDRFKVLP